MNIALTRQLLAGLHAGDSLGSTTEFAGRAEVERTYQQHKSRKSGWPFKQVGGGAFSWEPGAPTDDTDMAMCLIRAAIDAGGKFDVERTAVEFANWLSWGPRDVGGTTRNAINRLKTREWYNAGHDLHLTNKFNAANGSLMRNGVLPGIVTGGDVDDLFTATIHHAIVTHYHPLPTLCCLMQSWLIADRLTDWQEGPFHAGDEWVDNFFEDYREYVETCEDAHVEQWVDRTREQFQDAGDAIEAAEWDADAFNPFTESYASRSGYCLLTLQIGVWAMEWADRIKSDPAGAAVLEMPDGMPFADDVKARTKHPADVLAWVAMIGHDSDTYGATAGAMVAAAHPMPSHLTDGLKALDAFDKLIAAKGAAVKDVPIT